MAAAQPLQQKYTLIPSFHIQSPGIRDQIAQLLEKYLSEEQSLACDEIELSDRKWCILTLLNIASSQSLRAGGFKDTAKAASLAAHLFLEGLESVGSETSFASYEHQEAVSSYNALSLKTRGKAGQSCTLALQLDSALKEGGLLEVRNFLNIADAQWNLACLGKTKDAAISFIALDALSFLSISNLSSEEDSSEFSLIIGRLKSILEDGKKALPKWQLKKCTEAIAMMFDRWLYVCTRPDTEQPNSYEESQLENLKKHFRYIYSVGESGAALWATFSLLRFQGRENPPSVAETFEKAKTLLLQNGQSRARNRAAEATATEEERGAEANEGALEFITEGIWAKSLEQIIPQIGSAREDVSALSHLQRMMLITLKVDMTSSFAYFCIHILTEICMRSNSPKVQAQAFHHEALPSLQFFIYNVAKSVSGGRVPNEVRKRNALYTSIAKHHSAFASKEIWTSPRLILAAVTALGKLQNCNASKVKKGSSQLVDMLEGLRVFDSDRGVIKRIYEGRKLHPKIAQEYSSLVSQELGAKIKEEADEEELERFSKLFSNIERNSLTIAGGNDFSHTFSSSGKRSTLRCSMPKPLPELKGLTKVSIKQPAKQPKKPPAKKQGKLEAKVPKHTFQQTYLKLKGKGGRLPQSAIHLLMKFTMPQEWNVEGERGRISSRGVSFHKVNRKSLKRLGKRSKSNLWSIVYPTAREKREGKKPWVVARSIEELSKLRGRLPQEV